MEYKSQKQVDSDLKQENERLKSINAEMLEYLSKVNEFINDNKDKNYMVELLRREIPSLELLIQKATTL